MAKAKASTIQVTAYPDHQVINQPNPLRQALRRATHKDRDDPIARAEAALAGLAGEFTSWMTSEADRLSAAYAAIQQHGFNEATTSELFRAAHDIKSDGVTFGYPSASVAAQSLCRIIEHAPRLDAVPPDLFAHHINAIQAIVHDHTKLDSVVVAEELSKGLRKIAEDYLLEVNGDRFIPIETIALAPSIVPGRIS